ncbi:thiol reductant ABC exporter subunit CydC [Rhodobium gokarnense]|uniref:ATP-binding cassette subfamily C protein CydC n=1 Tax=Rhodobium gokarnense TaxID=364296 RepID=A0ABT3HC99_9HYPH|nr:thiol reductant ABC exporter subunit CydC [Rhodobium gokarnense]MCW2308034.1 ATP-binding cassette subfamily C protein CydC [Rhodobium gokarnense]
MSDLLRLLKLFRPYWLWMAGSILLSLASVLANVGLMAVSGWFITAMALAGLAGVSMNYFTPAALIRAFAIVRTVGRYAERVISHEATFRLLAELRTWFYRRIEPLAPAGLAKAHSGDVHARIGADIDRLELVFLRVFAPVTVAALASLVVIAVLFAWHPLIAASQAVLLALAGIALPVLVARAGSAPSERLTHQGADMNTKLVDMLDGLGTLQAYGFDASHAARIDALTGDMIAEETRLSRLSGLSIAGVGLATNLALLAAIALAVPAVRSGALAPADLAMVALLAMASFEAIGPLPLAAQSLGGTLASARRIFALADGTPPVPVPASPAPLPRVAGDVPALSFRGVTFAYPGSPRPALSGIDLDLMPGTRTGILGASGSGKSSLVNLALRFWPPDAGSIFLCGTDVATLDPEDVRRKISAVSQHAHLFTASIAENLRVAAPDAALGKLEEACRIAQVHDFIAAQPDGYDTLVGANGLKLSGGEARRIAVARALLKEAPILLLDEPGEGLDRATETAMLDALFDATRERAVLYITHRPVALERMHALLLMERSRIVDRRAGHQMG